MRGGAGSPSVVGREYITIETLTNIYIQQTAKRQPYNVKKGYKKCFIAYKFEIS